MIERALLVASTAVVLVGCGSPPEPSAPPPMYSAPPPTITSAPPPTPTTPPAPAARAPTASSSMHVYRLEFSLTSKDGATAGPPTSFALVLEENHTGEVMIGKNVPLVSPAPTAAPNAPVVSARQDVGLKVKAHYRTAGDDVMLDVNVEMSTHDPPSTIRKIVVQGNALASPSKPSQIVVLDDDKKHYELSVTPTRLR
jgi:hypothetical protein